MTFSDTLTSVVPILVELVEKAESKAEFRATEGRHLSADTMETLRGLKDRLESLVGKTEVAPEPEATKEEPEPEEQPKEAVEPESFENSIAALESELELTLLESA